MLKYILKRIGLSILILIGVSLIIYTLVRLMPFDFVQQRMAQMGQDTVLMQDAIENLKKAYGLGDNSFKGIISGYFSWLGNLAQFDLGKSFLYSDDVLNVIVKYMGVSFTIAFIAIIFEFMIAIPLGVTAATHQYSVRDYVVTVFVMVGISFPSFFFARILQGLLASKLGWFPVQGFQDSQWGYTGIARMGDKLYHMILPLISMILLGIGGTMRYTRTNMLEVLNADYIRTARAKGLSEGKVIYKHAFRNTMIPIVTTLAGILPSLFSGALITEQIFDLPGIGNIALQATTAADIPFIMGYNMFLAFLSVVGVLLSDLMYMVVDPRVKLA